MKRSMRNILLAVGVAILGGWAPAYGQMGDCYDSKPGCLDPSFGVNGRVVNQQGMSFDGVAIQQVAGESRIVVVGVISGVWTIARYRPDGTPDLTFGNNGIVQHNFPVGSSRASAVVVQPDNKLVVVGSGQPQRNKSAETPTIVRYLRDGALDTSFGSNGAVSVPYGGSMGWSHAVALQSDGKIAVLAEYYYAGLRAVRLNPNGTLDTTYNGSGLSVDPNPGGGHEPGGITIQTIGSEERIVVAGSLQRTYPYAVATLIRFTSSGTLDTSFGGTGVVETVLPPVPGSSADSHYYDVQVDSNNRLVAAAAAYWQGMLVRYDEFGILDTSFGTGGFAIPPQGMNPPNEVSGLHALGIQPDGTILVAGEYYLNNYTNCYAANWRFTDSGAPDTYFGFGGWVTTDFPNSSSTMRYKIVHMAPQPDGKFVVAGHSAFNDGNKAILLRYYGAGHPTHDIAVYSISASPIVATQGDTVTVRVTVINNGTSAETANVTVTESPGGNSLGTPQSVSLAPGEAYTLTFAWATDLNTTTGEHTLQATDTLTTAGVTDEQTRNDSRSTTVTVVPVGVNIALSANGYRVKNIRRADLSWTGAYTSSVDIYRNGALLTIAPNTGAFTDYIGGKSAGTFVYKVCDTRSTRCSNLATVVF